MKKPLKIIKVKQTEKGEAYLDLQDFAGLVDIEKVDKYTLEEIDDDGTIALLLTFYDVKGRALKTK